MGDGAAVAHSCVPVYFEGMDVLDWLLDADPSIRWQVLRDLTDAPAEDVHAERARVATEGWGARFLSCKVMTASGTEVRTTRRRSMNPRTASPGPLRPTACCSYASSGSNPKAKRPAARSGSSARTAAGRRAGSRSSTGKWNRASTAWRWPSEPISAKTSTAWSRGCSANSSRTAAGTAKRNGAPHGHPSPPRSTCSKGCWNTNASPAGRRHRSQPGSAQGSTCSSAHFSDARAPAN